MCLLKFFKVTDCSHFIKKRNTYNSRIGTCMRKDVVKRKIKQSRWGFKVHSLSCFRFIMKLQSKQKTADWFFSSSLHTTVGYVMMRDWDIWVTFFIWKTSIKCRKFYICFAQKAWRDNSMQWLIRCVVATLLLLASNCCVKSISSKKAVKLFLNAHKVTFVRRRHW